MELEHKIEILRPAWFKVHSDPSKNYGVGGVMLRFSTIGPKGAISWSVLTGWHLPKTYEWWESRGVKPAIENMAMGGSIDIHSPEQMYEWDSDGSKCDLLPEGRCYGDSGFTAGSDLFETMVEKGEEAVWATLDSWYASHFEEEESDV